MSTSFICSGQTHQLRRGKHLLVPFRAAGLSHACLLLTLCHVYILHVRWRCAGNVLAPVAGTAHPAAPAQIWLPVLVDVDAPLCPAACVQSLGGLVGEEQLEQMASSLIAHVSGGSGS